jgi:hypothetical protein
VPGCRPCGSHSSGAPAMMCHCGCNTCCNDGLEISLQLQLHHCWVFERGHGQNSPQKSAMAGCVILSRPSEFCGLSAQAKGE